jgi:hypothetical protein
MCKFLGLFIFVTSLYACTSKQEEEVSFDELTESSEKYKEGQEKNQQEKKDSLFYDQLSDFSKFIVDSLAWNKESIIPIDSMFFSDRFGAKKVEKWVYKPANDSIVWMHWEFKDSVKTLNTFYNWLDCYGKNCASYTVGQAAKFSKRATLFLVQDKHLVFLEADRAIDYERLLTILEENKWVTKWKYVVYQAPRKKASWIQREIVEKPDLRKK